MNNTTPADTIIPRTLNSIKRVVVEDMWERYVGKVVVVVWWDAQSVATSWEEHEGDGYGVPVTVSAGWLWEVQLSHVTLVAVLNETHHTHGIAIPRGCIRSITALEDPE